MLRARLVVPVTALELAAEAERALAIGCDRAMLVFPPGWKAPQGFPRREVACVNSKGDTVAWVKAERLLAWVQRLQGPRGSGTDGPLERNEGAGQ
jgi:hypothetical protein